MWSQRLDVWIQESLANAKVSARQPWYVGRNSLNRPPLRIAQQYQRNLYIFEKYFQCSTVPSLTVRVCLISFSRCCLPNMPTSAKFRENLNAQQFKVIQGRWFWYQSKAHNEFLLVINSNFGPIFNRLWLIHPCDGQTDRQTDGRTDGRWHIARYSIYAVAR